MWKNSSGIRERLIVSGKLVFITPAIFQSNDTEGLADFVILRDKLDGSPLLPGSSLAGALRSYLMKILPPTGSEGLNQENVSLLFGIVSGDTTTRSWLFVEDAFGVESGVELRPGIRIDPITQTAAYQGLYDMELLSPGSAFTIEFEFRLPQINGDSLKTLLYAGLSALERGHIRLGGKKNRGLGKCIVQNWNVQRYRMHDKKDILRWLKDDRTSPEPGKNLWEKLGFSKEPEIPADETLRISAEFGVSKTLMIRSYPTDPNQPDMVHMTDNNGQPIIPGTSIAGVLRAQARRIAALKLQSKTAGDALINQLFGSEAPGNNGQLAGSRLIVHEGGIEDGGYDLLQNRIKIDPFTGGTYKGALFVEKPQLDGVVTLKFEIAKPTNSEAGILLLILKDLWDGFLTIGGESAIGRGHFEGIEGELIWDGKVFDMSDEDGIKITPVNEKDNDLITTALDSLQPSAKHEELMTNEQNQNK
jgi:CRISPR/Cas system CSM-associated protein Csm3 (group 7 of RAMP superfamily)